MSACPKRLHKARLQLFSESIDLALNGYQVLLTCQFPHVIVMSLRHRKNGHKIVLKAYENLMTITKDGRIVKQVTY